MENPPDLEVGQKAVREYQFTPERVDAFADLVGDHAPIHTDETFARSKGFVGKIVHGLFVGSIFSGLLGEELPGPRSVINSLLLKYRGPVPVGATVRYEAQVKQIVVAVGAVVLDLKASLEDGTLCISGTTTCSFPKET